MPCAIYADVPGDDGGGVRSLKGWGIASPVQSGMSIQLYVQSAVRKTDREVADQGEGGCEA